MSGGHVPPECHRLACALRELRERTGLSMAALAERTPYSKSSWERYLNAKKLPPRQAVDALCALAGEPAGRLLALWELAEQAWSGRAGAAPVPHEGPGTRPNGGAGPREEPGRGEVAEGRRGLLGSRRMLLALAGAVAAAAVAVPLLVGGGAKTGGRQAPGSLGAAPTYSQSYEPGCKGEECEGENPQDKGCGAQNVVRNVLVRTARGGQRLEIRYADQCAAVWARAMDLKVGDRVEVTVPGARPKSVRAANEKDTELYLSTPMTATEKPRRATVCLIPGGVGRRECFTPPPAATA